MLISPKIYLLVETAVSAIDDYAKDGGPGVV